MSGSIMRVARRLVLGTAVAMIGVGAALAIHGRVAGRAGPASVVVRYFAALQRGDAASALAFGPIPAGSRALLSESALRAQQRDAPVRDVVVLDTTVTGANASVRIGYQLGFANGPVTVAATVGLHLASDGWQLDGVAVPTRFAFSAASQRASIAGVRVPAGRALLFPGAVALQFDTPYLDGSAENDELTFGAPSITAVDVGLTAAGQRAAVSGVRTSLASCLTSGGDVSCPQPDDRVVPGSVRGVLDGELRGVTISLDTSPIGLAIVQAQAAARVTYQRLDFTDAATPAAGTVTIGVRADVLMRRPVSVRWTA